MKYVISINKDTGTDKGDKGSREVEADLPGDAIEQAQGDYFSAHPGESPSDYSFRAEWHRG